MGIGWIKREGKAGKRSVGPQEAQSHLVRGSEKGQRVWAVTGSGGAGQRRGGSYSLSSCKDPWRERVASCHSALGDQAWPECRNQSSHRPNRLWGIKTFPSCWWPRRLCKSSLGAALSPHLDHQLCERQGSWTRDLVTELGARTTVNIPTPPPPAQHTPEQRQHTLPFHPKHGFPHRHKASQATELSSRCWSVWTGFPFPCEWAVMETTSQDCCHG